MGFAHKVHSYNLKTNSTSKDSKFKMPFIIEEVAYKPLFCFILALLKWTEACKLARINPQKQKSPRKKDLLGFHSRVAAYCWLFKDKHNTPHVQTKKKQPENRVKHFFTI